MRTPRLLILLLLLAAVALPTWAGPARVALLRVERGPVTLNGKLVSTPQLVEEGARIVVKTGDKIRLQLMEQQGEVYLTGPQTITVRATELAKWSRDVKRDDLSGSLPDIGNTTRAASHTTRQDPVPPHRKRGISFGDLVAQDGSWVFPVKTTPYFFQDGPGQVNWTVSLLAMSSEQSELPTFKSQKVDSGESDGKHDIRISKDLLKLGQRYVLEVIVYPNGRPAPLGEYRQPFRLLSQEEKASLALLETQANEKVSKEASLLPLIELSTILLEWDQLGDADRILQQVMAHPDYSKLPRAVDDSVKKFQRDLNEIWDRPPYRDDKK